MQISNSYTHETHFNVILFKCFPCKHILQLAYVNISTHKDCSSPPTFSRLNKPGQSRRGPTKLQSIFESTSHKQKNASSV